MNSIVSKHKERWGSVVISLVFIALTVSVLTLTNRTRLVSAQSSTPDFGNGSDGNLTVTSGQIIYTDSARSALATTANAGQKQIIITNVTDFTASSEVLVVQIQGTGAGNYEFGIVDSIGTNSLILKSNLNHNYLADGSSKAQVIRVPHYQSLVVQSNGVLTAHAWNGDSGGILAFRASQGSVIENGGSLTVAGLGFRGGPGGSPDGPSTATQGEGTGGNPTQNATSNGNGGGGSQETICNDGHYAAGGGGGNGTVGEIGGSQFAIPGQGGTIAGTNDLSNLTFGGGGGGEAACSISYNGSGGTGGGAILIFSANINVAGTISANGVGGSTSFGGSTPVGGGGGGAGGSILIKTNAVDLGSNAVTAIGGPRSAANDNNIVFGGKGGDGRIRIEYCNSSSGSTIPIPSVEQLSCIPPNHPPRAVAGTSLNQSSQIQLDGGLSSDPDTGDTLTYLWSISGQSNTRTGQITSITDLVPGNYNIGLTVTDSYGATDIDSVSIGIPEINHSPIVSAGSNTTTNRGGTFNLNSSFTDPDLDETHTATIYWGDGTKESGNVNGLSVINSHIYDKLGTFIVVVCVSDGKSQGCGDFTLQVVGGRPNQ